MARRKQKSRTHDPRGRRLAPLIRAGKRHKGKRGPGRPKGFKMSEATKKKISAALRKHHAARKHRFARTRSYLQRTAKSRMERRERTRRSNARHHQRMAAKKRK